MQLIDRGEEGLGVHVFRLACVQDVLRLTFELSGRRRQDARPGLAKMYRVPPDRAWWPAVGAPLERGVRPRWARHVHENLYLQPTSAPPDETVVTIRESG